MKHIYVVTHGKKFPGANPGMTEEGFEEVAKLRCLLPEKVSEVVCGTGKRHLDSAKALRLEPTRYTGAVGGPDSGEATVKGGPVDVVRLPCDTVVLYESYTTLKDGAEAMKDVVSKLSHNSVICAGRPSMIMLDMEESVSKSAAVYRLLVTTEDIRVTVGSGSFLRQRAGEIVKITEIAASGEAEIHTV